jgi:PAS domain S-box-containing protein
MFLKTKPREMNKQRTMESGSQEVRPASGQPEDELRSFYAEVFKELGWGMAILRLENPRDARTLRFSDLHPAAAHFAGSSLKALQGKTLGDFPELLKTPFAAGCLAAMKSGETKHLGDISCQGVSGTREVYTVHVVPLVGNRVCAVFEDVTERRRTEEESRKKEEQFRLLVQGVEEYALFQLDPQGNVVSWNRGAKRLKGYRADEIIGKHFSVFYAAEDVADGKPMALLAQAAERGQVEDEGWRIRKNGSRFWANVVVTALRDAKGALWGYAKVTRDLTERHEKEEALAKANELLELRVEQRAEVLARVNEELRTEIAERQRVEAQLRKSLGELRALAARLQSVREEERAAVAREIHDELGQACTAVKMDLVLVSKKTTKGQKKLREKIDATVRLVDAMIVNLRRIASELRPRTLDDLGLKAALEWQAQEFESRTGIRCQLTLPEERLKLDGESSTAIFRIFQESLTNALRHAAPTRVEARLETTESELIFRIQDNGKGFKPESGKERKSLGLVGMQERAILLNGELKIEGIPNVGTTLTLRIPFLHPPSPKRDSG